MKENWKPIKGYELNYEVSDMGNVRNKKTKKIIVGDKNNVGYRRVTLYTPIKKRFFVHRLVAYHFCHGYKEDLVVNHKDGNKLNNNFNNLEWVTRKENMRHAVDTGLLKEFQKSPVKQIDPQTNKIIKIFESIADAHKYLNKPPYNGYIYAAVRKMDKTAYGYKWEYV